MLKGVKNRCHTLAHIFILLLFAYGSDGQKKSCLSNHTKPWGTQLTASTFFLSQDELCRVQHKISNWALRVPFLKCCMACVPFNHVSVSPLLLSPFSPDPYLFLKHNHSPSLHFPPCSHLEPWSTARMISLNKDTLLFNRIPPWVVKNFSLTHYPSKYL